LNLAINNIGISITGQPNQTVQLPLGLGRLVINEQMTTTTGGSNNWSAITTNALHLYVTNVGDVAVSSSHADIACTPPARIYGAQGTVVNARVLNLTNRVSDTGPLPSWGGNLRSALPTVRLAGLVSASLLTANASGGGDESAANASAAKVGLSVAGLTIGASILTSNAQAVCNGSAAAVSGSSQIVALNIDGIPILVTGQPNQVIPLLVGQLVLNERVSSVNGASGQIVVNALHLQVAGVADVALASSSASITCVPMPACP
jgi:hypothetical protein